MISRLLRQAVVLGLSAVILKAIFPLGQVLFKFGKSEFSVPLYGVMLYIFIFLAAIEIVIYLLKVLVRALKNDVLISNHDFAADNDTSSSSAAGDCNKIVLSRNQFDEAAILLVKTMSAVTAGLLNEARRHLVNLRKIIGNDAIIDILMLKIYKGEKNFDKMEQLSQKLMENEDIQLVGMKAALEAQLEKKEFTEALKTVNQAFEVRQDLYWVIGSAFLLRAKNNDWLGALEVLDAGIEKNLMPTQKSSRLRAVALYELAKQSKADKDKTKFFKFITQALQEDNKLIPAALDLAEFYVKYDKQTRKAEKVLSAIWTENPCYEIAKAYLALFPKDTKAEKIQRMEKLALSNVRCPSLNNLILAELYTDAKKFAKAKTECRLFLLKNPATEKISALLTELGKKAQKSHKKADNLFTSLKQKFTTADSKNTDFAKDFQWVCANCGHTAETWQPICPECGEIGRAYWHLYVDKDSSTAEEI